MYFTLSLPHCSNSPRITYINDSISLVVSPRMTEFEVVWIVTGDGVNSDQRFARHAKLSYWLLRISVVGLLTIH